MLNTKTNIHTLTEITLNRHKVWNIEGDRRGDMINCMSGSLWITQEGDLRDYVIEAGRDFWVTKRGTVVVQALEDSQFKYNLNELDSHIEPNVQPIRFPFPSRTRHHLR